MSRNQDAPGHRITVPGSKRSPRDMNEVEQTSFSAMGKSSNRIHRWPKGTWNSVWLALLTISCVINLVPLRAQTSYGSVVGTITDSAGAVVAGAHVQLTNKGTNAAQKAVTGAAGTYTFINLNPGVYSVTVTNQGFKSATNDRVEVQHRRNNPSRFDFGGW